MTAKCETCGLSPPPKPACKMCGRLQEDWPDNPELFLSSRGWEPAPYNDGVWMEPIERCTFEVTDRDIEEAERSMVQAEKYLAFPSVQKSSIRKSQAEATVREAKDRLELLRQTQADGGRLPTTTRTDRVFRGTDKMGEVVYDEVVRPERRTRAQLPLAQAVRFELNLGIESFPPRKRIERKFGEKEMLNAEHSYLMKDKGNLSPESRAKLANMQSETVDSYEEQCATCRRWPDAK